MAYERCPRCGERLTLVEQASRHGGQTRDQVRRCPACGAQYGAAAETPSDGRQASGSRSAAALFWVVLSLIVLWFVVRPVPYTSFGPAVSEVARRIAVGFRSPAALVVLGILAAGAAAAWVRIRRRPRDLPAALAPDVHVRTAGEGRLAFVVADQAGALGRDFEVERDVEGERRLLGRFDALARRSTTFATTGVLPAAETRREIEESNREVYALGTVLADLALGGSDEARRTLAGLPGDHLLLRIQPDVAGFPWELMVPQRGGQYLWQLFHVGRQIRDEVGPGAVPVVRALPLRVLLLANLEANAPGRSLSDAEREAGLLLDLAKARSHLLRVVRRSPRNPEELRDVLAEGYDVVHFASHASYGHAGPVGWVLPDGVATGDALSGLEAPPPSLVFSNACGTGPGTGLESSRSGDLARSFLSWGAAAYLGTLWELHDSASADFALRFYRDLTGGATLGHATTAARGELRTRHPFAWANYVLYGNPAAVIIGTP